MNQRERIEEMEKHFERASDVVGRLSSTLDDFAQVQESIDLLVIPYPNVVARDAEGFPRDV